MTSTTAAGAAPAPSRDDRLVTVLGRASGRFRGMNFERALFAGGAALIAAGVACVIVGWVGASRTVLVAGQIPYLISGGLLGLGLIFLGGFLYFAHWVGVLLGRNTQTGADERGDLAGIRDRLDQLNRTVEDLAVSLMTVTGAVDGGSLVATATGTMMHLPDCAAVAGKTNLRVVTVADGLTSCGLCRPFERPA